MRRSKTILCACFFFMTAMMTTLCAHAQETAVLAPTKLIPVPTVRQATDSTCGVACVQSVLRYAGGYNCDLREDMLREPLGVKEDGTPFQPMADFLNCVPGTSASLRENLTIADLTAAIDAGSPVICLIQAWKPDESGEYVLQQDYAGKWDSGHYVVAIGHDDERIYFMDPSTLGNYTYIPRAELDARWHGLGEITPEGIEYFEHAGIVVSVALPGYSPEEFHKIL